MGSSAAYHRGRGRSVEHLHRAQWNGAELHANGPRPYRSGDRGSRLHSAGPFADHRLHAEGEACLGARVLFARKSDRRPHRHGDGRTDCGRLGLAHGLFRRGCTRCAHGDHRRDDAHGAPQTIERGSRRPQCGGSGFCGGHGGDPRQAHFLAHRLWQRDQGIHRIRCRGLHGSVLLSQPRRGAGSPRGGSRGRCRRVPGSGARTRAWCHRRDRDVAGRTTCRSLRGARSQTLCRHSSNLHADGNPVLRGGADRRLRRASARDVRLPAHPQHALVRPRLRRGAGTRSAADASHGDGRAPLRHQPDRARPGAIGCRCDQRCYKRTTGIRARRRREVVAAHFRHVRCSGVGLYWIARRTIREEMVS